MQISDLKWIAVWCIQYKVLFGQLNFPESEAGTEESKEEQEESKDSEEDPDLEGKKGGTHLPSSEPMYFNGELLAEYQPMEWRH